MPDKPAQTWEQWLWNQGIRIAGGAAGATLGGVTGGPIGAIAGGATGAAIAEDWAQQREVQQGVREHVNPVSVFANAAASQIPGGTIGKVGSVPLRQVAGRLPKAFLAGLPGGAAASAVTQKIETGEVDPWQTAMEAGFSSSIGTAMAAATHTVPVAAKALGRNETGAVGPVKPPTHVWTPGDVAMVPESHPNEFQRGQMFTVKDSTMLGKKHMLLVENESGAQGWLESSDLRPVAKDPHVAVVQAKQYLREERPAREQQLRDLHAKHEEWVKRYTGDAGADPMQGRRMSADFKALKAKYARDYGDDDLERVVADLADVERQRHMDPNPPAWTPPVKPEPATPKVRAYHGSPHDFDQFSTAKIGTGEGAQAYGHGLYFAENEGVGKGYRDALADPRQVTVDGTQYLLNTESPVDRALFDLSQGRADPAAIRHSGVDARFADEYEKTVQTYQGRVQAAKPGKMYEVEINADPEQFLDWDKPLSEQPKVLAALRANDLADDTHVFTPEGAKPLAEVTGDDLYRGYRGARGAAVTSRAARRIGIPGVKYLDQGSRAEGEGSRNYVVFDDKLVSILRKYGLLPFATLGNVAGQSKRDERETKK